jgi:hypothetical protein
MEVGKVPIDSSQIKTFKLEVSTLDPNRFSAELGDLETAFYASPLRSSPSRGYTVRC